MGRHVNYADEQDRWLNKADKINRSNKSKNLSLEERDPGSLTLLEQIELIRQRNNVKKKLVDRKPEPKKRSYVSFYQPDHNS
jgi:hypothetical protein